jgi:hypothetical protein
MADLFEDRVADPLMQGTPTMAHLILAVALDVAAKRVPAYATPRGKSTPARQERLGLGSSAEQEPPPSPFGVLPPTNWAGAPSWLDQLSCAR